MGDAERERVVFPVPLDKGHPRSLPHAAGGGMLGGAAGRSLAGRWTTAPGKGRLVKSETHPDYRQVVFRDQAAGYAFLTRSTATSDETIEWDDGETYPVIDVEISSESHPFYTGRARVVDSEGQIAKFRRRYETPTPDHVLHTGPEGEPTPEDVVLASGRDLNEANLAWARERIAKEGRAALERELP